MGVGEVGGGGLRLVRKSSTPVTASATISRLSVQSDSLVVTCT